VRTFKLKMKLSRKKGRPLARPTKCVEALEPRRLLAAVPFADLRLSEGEDYQVGLPTMARVNDTTYFAVNGDINRNSELWKIDLSGNKTLIRSLRVSQIFSGSTPPPTLIGHMTPFNGAVLFTTGNSSGSLGLWRTDGTAQGTVFLKDLSSGSTNGFYHDPEIKVVGDRAYLLAPSSSLSPNLWTTDGTGAGTQLISMTSPASSLVSVGGALYYSRNGDLYRTTNTGAGTKVSDEAPSRGRNVIAFNDDLYFFSLQHLYRFDPQSSQTTQLAANIAPENFPYASFTPVGDTLFFIASSASSTGAEVWKTDGTPEGTSLVKDVLTNGSSTPRDLVGHGGLLYFSADDAVHGRELWRTDGTETGTRLVKDINPGTVNTPISNLHSFGDHLYFRAASPEGGYELWQTDGTEDGTRQAVDLYPGPGGSAPRELTTIAADLYFQASHPVTGRGLFNHNVGAAPSLVHDHYAGGLNANIDLLVSEDGRLYFRNGDFSHTGRELYVGAVDLSGAALLKDIHPSAFTASNPQFMTQGNGAVFFAATDRALGTELWKTDGTAAGTVLVKDISSPLTGGSGSSNPRRLIRVGNLVFFVADHGDFEEHTLGVTDGTTAGTRPVKSAGPPAQYAHGGNWHVVHNGNMFYDYGTLAVVGPAAPEAVTPLTGRLAGALTYVTALASAGGYVYFAGGSSMNDLELWRSDGTQAGTALVKEINTLKHSGSPLSSNPYGFIDFKNGVYFAANDGVTGYELWKTDGTANGTVLVKDIFPGGAAPFFNGSNPTRFVVHNDTLYFVASALGTGAELWKSDGTAAGTVLVKDINPGKATSDIRDFTAVGGRLYFTATDPAGGRELWTTDGTDAGTRRAADLFQGPMGSNPLNLRNAGGTLVFTANDGVSGPKLFKWVPDTTPPAATSAGFDRAAPSPSITVEFSENVSASLTESDLVVKNITTGQTIDPSLIRLSYDPAAIRATFTFDGTKTLTDGNYSATLPAAAVTDAEGNALPADVTVDFHVLAADADGDRTVGFADLVILAQNYGTPGKTFAEGNFDFDPAGDVNFNDLVILAQRYNTSLPPLDDAIPVASVVATRRGDSPFARSTIAPESISPRPLKRNAAPPRRASAR
jgi:ELWxxDGT repeat protein